MSASTAIGAYRPLPPEALYNIYEFLDEQSLARSEGVCKDWHLQITSQDHHTWRIFCRNTHLYTFPSRGELSAEMEGLSTEDATCAALASVFGATRTFDLIFGYADENYKELAHVIHGTVILDPSNVYINIPGKQGLLANLPWGRSEEEPFIPVTVYNQESLDITVRKAEEGDVKAAMRLRGEWHYDYPKIPTRKFPKSLPLRLFYKRDGSLKNHGDVLQLDYKGKRVQLQCDFNERMNYTDTREFQTYAEAITYRIDVSMRNFSHVTQSRINGARDAAMAETRTWIPSEARS